MRTMRNEYVYESKKVGKYTVKVVQEYNPTDPRTEWDNLCTMVCFHSRYNLGDRNHGFTPESIREYLSENKKTVFWKPLYLYDHSGITISTGPFSCPWDSGQVGYIFVERDRFLKEFGYKRMTKKAKERLEALLEGEVEDYDKYLTGEVYGYMVEDEEGNCVDSCWGFYGETKDVLEEGVSEAEANIRNDIKEHLKKLKIWIKNKVPLDKRKPLMI